VSPELSQLIELQELDLEIQRIADRLASIPAERKRLEDDFKQYAAEFLALKSKHEQLLEERKHLEAELAIAQQHHEKYKQDLMRVTNEKQYITALREIDAAKKQISALETEILKRMEEAEKLEAEVNAFAPDIERKRAEVDREITVFDRESQLLSQRLDGFKRRRQELVGSVPQNLFSMYERVARLRRGQALAEVRDGTCTACRMKVRPKVFSDVRKGDSLVTCESCGRILFYRPNTSSAEAAT
jgi:predicted  nucleic acid-binding Zn-ribbon protein